MTRKYDIGYRKPPKHSRFKQGQSGNPVGRPKGTRNFKTDVVAALKAPVRISKDGVQKNVPAQTAALLRLVYLAVKGNVRALAQFIALAEIYNNEEPQEGPRTDLSEADREILRGFLKRHLDDKE